VTSSWTSVYSAACVNVRLMTYLSLYVNAWRAEGTPKQVK